MNIRTLERALDGIRDTNLAKLRTNALRWMKVVADNPSQHDGYPTSTLGALPSTAPSPLLEPDEAPLNAVERAATAKRRRDVIDMNTTVAAQWIVQAEDLLRRAEHKLLENERYQSDKDLNPKPECWVMRQRADVYKEQHCKTDFAGYLPDKWEEARPVCRWVYDFVRENLVLPTREQCRQYANRQRVMIQVQARKAS